MPMKKRTEKRLQVEVDKCTRQISLIYELKHFNDRLEATPGTRGFSRLRRVFSRCKRVYSGFCEVGCRPATQPFLMSSRNAPGRALREDTKNGCVTDYCRPRQSSGWAMEPLVADLFDRHISGNRECRSRGYYGLQESPFRTTSSQELFPQKMREKPWGRGCI